jgi:hypothetical protein
MGWLFVSAVFWQNEFKDLVPGAVIQQLNVTVIALTGEAVWQRSTCVISRYPPFKRRAGWFSNQLARLFVSSFLSSLDFPLHLYLVTTPFFTS